MMLGDSLFVVPRVALAGSVVSATAVVGAEVDCPEQPPARFLAVPVELDPT